MFRPGSLGLDAPPGDDRYRMNAGVRSRSQSSVAQWIKWLAKKAWLTAPALPAAAQMRAEEIVALFPATCPLPVATLSSDSRGDRA
jgi:Tfp pilus assembly protein PilN